MLPYRNRVISIQEVVNESTVVIASYHLLCFTEWIYDIDRRLECGWSLLILIALNVLFNITLILTFVIKTFYRNLRLRLLKRNHKKKIAERRELNKIAIKAQ